MRSMKIRASHPVLSRVVAVSAGKDVFVEADDGEDVGVEEELAVADHLGGELPHAGLPVGKVHGDLEREGSERLHERKGRARAVFSSFVHAVHEAHVVVGTGPKRHPKCH